MESGDIEFIWLSNGETLKVTGKETDLSAGLKKYCNDLFDVEESLEKLGMSECFPARFGDVRRKLSAPDKNNFSVALNIDGVWVASQVLNHYEKLQ